jgi:cell division septation protein DedD
MASGGRRTASDRVLEGKHVIGLFLLMLLFSGVFFSLGYVMGKNQYEGQVNASGSFAGRSERAAVQPQADPAPKKSAESVSAASAETDPATSTSNSDWEFYGNNKPAKSEPHLEAAPKSPDTPPVEKALNPKTKVQPQPVSVLAKTAKSATAPPPILNGAYVLQVAALLKQDDALAVASSLQKKHYLCYVQAPQKDKYYRVQVGPFKDRKAADAAKQGLENEGFNAFYVKH